MDNHDGSDSFAMLKKIGVQGRFLTELADRLPETVLAGYWHTRQQKGLKNPIGFFVRSLIAEYPLPLGLELLAEAIMTGKTNISTIESLLEARQLNVLRDELGDEATASAEFVATIGWELAPL